MDGDEDQTSSPIETQPPVQTDPDPDVDLAETTLEPESATPDSPLQTSNGVPVQNGTLGNREEAQRLITSIYRSGRLRQADLALVERVKDQLRDPKVTSIPESRMTALRELELERGVGH